MPAPHDSPAADPPAAPRRPGWYRLGLAGVLILLTLAGAGFGWRLSLIRPERAAVAEIRDAGGTTQTSWEYRFLREPDQGLDQANRPEASNVQVEPTWPPLLLDALGADFFNRATAAHLPRGEAAAPLIPAVARLGALELLSIPDSSRLGGALGPLRRLGSLRGVYVDGAGLGTADLADLAAVPGLRLLAIGSDQGAGALADADLAALGAAARVEGFRLGREPAVTDEGMAALVAKWPALEEFAWLEVGHPAPATLRALAEHHPGLRRLALTGAPLADADLAPLARMAGLVTLRLDGPGLTDAALAGLANHRRLVSLFLPGLEVEGDGLKALAGLGDLRFLDLRRSKLAAAGLADLPRLGRLAELDLSGAELAGPAPGWAPLAAWAQLETLSLGGSNLDDAGLRALAPLKATLRTLDVANSAVTAEAMAAFKAGAPASFHLVEQRPRGAAGAR